MREIKFRAWDEGTNMMHPTFTIYEIGDIRLNEGGNIGSAVMNFNWDGLIWEQFTGLHDSTGKEIYEGDVVITNHETNRVVFASGSFCLYNTGEGLYEIHSSDINIIGNIHENSDLL